MTEKEMNAILNEGIGKDCIGQTIFGGDTLRLEGKLYKVVWNKTGWALLKKLLNQKTYMKHLEMINEL